MNNAPLISVIVVTYNSSKFIVETLNSIKNQTYKNIELLVSDDGSKDDSVEIAFNWINDNKSRFYETRIITTGQNTGIPANCNRGFVASKGEYVKPIAADDVLLPDCIENMLTYCQNNHMEIAISPVIYIDNDGKVFNTQFDSLDDVRNFFKKGKEDRLKSYVRYPLFLFSPTVFLSKKLYDSVGGFDERIPLLEDQPFFVKCFRDQVNFGLYHEATVKYRKHPVSALSNTKFSENQYLSYLLYRKPHLKSNALDRIFEVVESMRFKILKRTDSGNFLYKVLSRFYLILVKIYN